MKAAGRTHLLFRPGALGDALLTVPLVAQLSVQHPGDELVWYQSPWTCELPWAKILPAELLHNARLVIKSFEDPECANWLSLDESADHALDEPAFLVARQRCRSITLVAARPMDGLAGWCQKNGIAFRWVAAPTGAVQEPPHAAERLCGHAIDLRHPWLHNKVPARQRNSSLAVLHPGAGSTAKRMSLMQWVELAKKLRAQNLRVRYILGPAEQESGVWKTLAAMDSRSKLLPTPTLSDLVQRLRLTTEFWGHDSGPAHLAGMLGVRTHVFFGPTNPDVWRPLGPDVIVHRFNPAATG